MNLLSIASAFAVAALAAAPFAATSAAEDDSSTTIAEIVVTAQERSQSAQNVGISITEVDGEELSALRIQQPIDLAGVAPSLTTVNATTDGTPLFMIHGVYLDGLVTETIGDIRGLATYATLATDSRLPVAPPWSYDWLVRYERPLQAGLRVYGQANDRWSGHTHSLLGDPNVYGPSHSLDARLGLKSDRHSWDVSLWAANLSDNRAVTYAFAGSFGQAVSYYQKPRACGINITNNF